MDQLVLGFMLPDLSLDHHTTMGFERFTRLVDDGNNSHRLPGFARFLETAQDDHTHRRRQVHAPLWLRCHDDRSIATHSHHLQIVDSGSSISSKLNLDNSPSAPTRSLSSSSSLSSTGVVRPSRYLREQDRRAILTRIQNGEKQADLAREYHVSRAAISNLKQRRRRQELKHEAARGRQNPKLNCDDNQKDQEDQWEHGLQVHDGSWKHLRRRDQPSLDSVSNCIVHGVSVAHLVTQLQRRNSLPPAAIRLTLERLARLVLEETVGRLYATNEDVVDRRPVCAVTIKDGDKSQLLLNEFRLIEPCADIGSVHTETPLSSSKVHAVIDQAPENPTNTNVVLLSSVCSETGDEICAAIEALRDGGVDIQRMAVTTLVACRHGLERVLNQFPQLAEVLTIHVVSSSSGQTTNNEWSLVKWLQTQ